ncbi:MAG TPA: c-type cytochrome [Terracidiphilus sp.]|nr:c-type cytochrome [Terracidiphilus sp.]
MGRNLMGRNWMRVMFPPLASFLAFAAAGCGHAPGYPGPAPIPPGQVVDFNTLYSHNCSACHGVNGQNGPAVDLGNPEYQALVDDTTLRKWISNGFPDTEMPAFAQSAGGMLTDAQIGAIVTGMRQHWGAQNAFEGATPPPYAADKSGDPHDGAQLYKSRCAICHSSSSGEITSASYLALVSDQSLRTMIVAGRPDTGQPDWRHDSPGGKLTTPLSSSDVDDIVAYLATLRNPGAGPSSPASTSTASPGRAASSPASAQPAASAHTGGNQK